MSHVRLLVTACLLAIGAVVSPLGVGAALAHPTADFVWTPETVVAGTPVTFTSTSEPFHEPFTPITRWEWSIEGVGTLEGEKVTVTFPAAGTWSVTLHVWDEINEDGVVTKPIEVVPPPLPPPPPPPSPANEPPNAAFAALPGSPLVGEEVTFVSYSDDRDGHVTDQAWDLNGDGIFDDATGPIATRRFSAPGGKTVALRVTDEKGAVSTLSLTVLVREQPSTTTSGPSPPTSRQPVTGPMPLPSMLSPFPIVRLVGSVIQAGTRIELLAVRAPRGARALVRCRGRGCPVKRAQKLVGRRPVRFLALKRLMPAGVVLEVLVRRGDSIGKYTRFKLRQNRRPQRTDGCLWPGTKRMAPCPEA